MKATNRLLLLLITLTVAFNVIGGTTARSQVASTPEPEQSSDLDARIDALLDQMSVEERVGQLFMVNFVGQNATPADAISELILDYKIGGVFLMETANNIDNSAEDTPAQVARLVNQLQTRTYEAAQGTGADAGVFLPLFIATDHEGDGYPNTRLRNGFTPIPSTMALGATWSPDDVGAIGAIIGKELAAVGVNMLLGPVVDVLERPRPEGSGDINIRAFGGSPFWVGEMGRAYIRGVHEGSGGRVLTIAKHFPGHGASDRLPDDEVATVNKSLNELRQSDLVPFFAVTEPDPADPLGVTDGMLPSHIRYRGFQGDVTQLTRPISLDREGMEAFMALPPLAEWRKEGLVVCDSLGVTAVKSYYDPTLQSFPAKQIAKDALMAGNDVLPLVSFAPVSEPSWFGGQLPTIQDTITFFQEEYRANEPFRRRVDDAVRHILRAKLRLYPELTLEEVLVPRGESPPGEGQSKAGDDVAAEVARKALTLLYPPLDDLPRRLPSPPRRDEDILIMGCFEDCLPFVRITGDTVRDALLDLYGPDGSDLIDPERVHSMDFMQLYQMLTGKLDELAETNTAQAMLDRIQAADWIILILINYMPDTQPQSGAGKLILREPTVTVNGAPTRIDLREKTVVALALHAPYYLDATEIGKLNAYFAVYTKVKPALEVALRAMFQEITPESAPPVSVEGIGYDLSAALQPDPEQSLGLKLEPQPSQIENGGVWHVGDEVHLRTEPILDHNGNPVPDRTRVRFWGSYADLPISLSPRLITDTVDGVAWAVFRPVEPGRLQVMASTDDLEARQLSFLIAPLAPTPEPSQTPTTTATQTVVSPSATAPLATDTIVPATPTASSPPATATIRAVAAVTGTPAVQDAATARGPGLNPAPFILVALLAVGVLAFVGYRRRTTSQKPLVAQPETVPEETGTASVDLPALTPELTGRTLGSCQVGEKLGEGGMGQVYKGHHPMLDRQVAIKILPPAMVQSEEMRARFTQEARIAASLRHPNIVQIYDFGEANGLYYMTMEYVEGSSLKVELAQLQAAGDLMPVEKAITVAQEIADALAYAHERGAIHRDLKPGNILLTEGGHAILVDFGLAVLRGGPRYTEPGKVWGSPNYIAPEQLGDSPRVDARSDIYSLGIVLYEMVTGRPPFKGESVMEVLWCQANVPPRAPSQLAPDIPPDLERIILHALAKDPDERYASAKEMADALKALHK
jgi:beta-N-acetylhexosaminidase